MVHEAKGPALTDEETTAMLRALPHGPAPGAKTPQEWEDGRLADAVRQLQDADFKRLTASIVARIVLGVADSHDTSAGELRAARETIRRMIVEREAQDRELAKWRR